jgi:hypothetical protein
VKNQSSPLPGSAALKVAPEPRPQVKKNHLDEMFHRTGLTEDEKRFWRYAFIEAGKKNHMEALTREQIRQKINPLLSVDCTKLGHGLDSDKIVDVMLAMLQEERLACAEILKHVNITEGDDVKIIRDRDVRAVLSEAIHLIESRGKKPETELPKETDAGYWMQIRLIGWDDEHHDYRNKRVILRTQYAPEDLKLLAEFARDRAREMKNTLNAFANTQPEGIRRYWGCGDDSFWDLCCHIVGLGKETFGLITCQPGLAKRIRYKENFLYVFTEP